MNIKNLIQEGNIVKIHEVLSQVCQTQDIASDILNSAILVGNSSIVSTLLNHNPQPNSDTALCLLFSGLPEFMATAILNLNSNIDMSSAAKHVEFSGMDAKVRNRIISNNCVEDVTVSNPKQKNNQSILKYAQENLGYLSEKYGDFKGLKGDVHLKERISLFQQQHKLIGDGAESSFNLASPKLG